MLAGMATMVCAMALLAGCGGEVAGDDPVGLGPADADAGAGDVPITPRGVAAVALVHLPSDTTSRAATPESQEGGELQGAELRYRADADYDGDLVRVEVLGDPPANPEDLCQGADGCARSEDEDGVLVLVWDEIKLAADPGYVLLALVREDEMVLAYSSGPEVGGDPREEDRDISVEMLTELVEDPRLSLSTDQDVIDAGDRLDGWGIPDADDPATPTG